MTDCLYRYCAVGPCPYYVVHIGNMGIGRELGNWILMVFASMWVREFQKK